MLVLERCVPRGTEHVLTAPRLNLMSGAELSTAGRAMKRGTKVNRGGGSDYMVWSRAGGVCVIS